LKLKTYVGSALALAVLGFGGFLAFGLWSGGLGDDHEITLAHCRPRNLTTVDACWGFDASFQECRFYYAATGVPDAAFCNSLVSRAIGTRSPPCGLDSPAGWADVDCSRYALDDWSRCFVCKVNGPEAAHTYVYGYKDDCTAAIEQVTCNFDPVNAGRLLKRVPSPPLR